VTGLLGTSQLAGALRYALVAVEPVTAAQLTEPTPCRGWDLRALLLHMSDSLAAIGEGLCAGRVSLDPPDAGPVGDPVAAVTRGASQLLARCKAGPAQVGAPTPEGDVLIAGCPLTTGLLCSVGAIEIAMHAWDVSQACCTGRPIPEQLAGELLRTAAELIYPDERAPQFALPRHVPVTASASDRLAGFLGR